MHRVKQFVQGADIPLLILFNNGIEQSFVQIKPVQAGRIEKQQEMLTISDPLRLDSECYFAPAGGLHRVSFRMRLRLLAGRAIRVQANQILVAGHIGRPRAKLLFKRMIDKHKPAMLSDHADPGLVSIKDLD